MSDDLIRRSDAIKVIDRMKHRLIGNGCTYEFIRQMIEELPTIEPKRGEWIEIDDVSISCRCSVCGWEAHLYEDDVYGMPYCPSCGAMMKGADDE